MDARVIASAAVQFEWGNQWQGVINYYFGTKGCSNVDKQDKITSEFDPRLILQGVIFQRIRKLPLF